MFIKMQVYKVRKMMDKELGYVDASNPSITADQKVRSLLFFFCVLF